MPNLNPYVKAKQKRQPKPQYARVCPECGTAFVTSIVNKMCCQRACTEAQWRRNRPERMITVAQVRREEGLRSFEHKRPPEVKDSDVLEQIQAALPPAVLAVCLEVRALNKGRRAQLTAAAGD